MAMKQFNLDEHLANPSKKVITRDGKNVTIHCTNFHSPQPVVAEIEDLGYSTTFFENGRYSRLADSSYDLFFVTEKREGWVNISKEGVQKETLGCLVTRYVGSSIWPTEEAAKTAADADNVITIKIEWEE